MARWDGVIFDLGGTLAFLEGDWGQLLRLGALRLADHLASHGVVVDGQALADQLPEVWVDGWRRSETEEVQYTSVDFIRWALERSDHAPPDPDQIEEALPHLMGPELGHYRLFPGVRETLDALKEKGLRLGLMSNVSHHRYVEGILSRTGLGGGRVMSSHLAGRPKPHPEGLRRILEAWRLEPHRALMVGDTPGADVAAAARLGMPSVLIEWASIREGVERPDYRIAHLTELLAIVDGRGP